jgi:hypothetical protein
MKLRPSFHRMLRQARAGRRGGVCHGRLLGRPVRFMEHRGPPGFPGRPLRARQSRSCRRSHDLPARLEGHDVVFTVFGPLDLREKGISTPNPLARVFVRLRIARTVASTVARLATGLAGLHLGRAGFAPAGQLITFQKGLITSSQSRDPVFRPGRFAKVQFLPKYFTEEPLLYWGRIYYACLAVQ